MSEVLPDDYLRFAIYDAMRGVSLPTLKRALTEDERRVLADAVFASIKRAGWQVSFSPDYRSAHSAHGGGGKL